VCHKANTQQIMDIKLHILDTIIEMCIYQGHNTRTMTSEQPNARYALKRNTSNTLYQSDMIQVGIVNINWNISILKSQKLHCFVSSDGGF